MKQGRKIFWGLLFVLGAFALIVGKMGYLEGVGFWNILISIAIIGILVDGIWHRNFGMILFSIAFLIIVNDELLGMEAITPWPVLGAACLGTIGLSILFPDRKRRGNCRQVSWHNGYGQSSEGNFGTSGGSYKKGIHKGEEISGEEIWAFNSFGESVKYLTGNELGKAQLKNTFGSLIVYFDNATLKNGMAEVYVDNSFGSTVLHVPSDWRVIINADTVFGDAGERGHCNPTGNNTLQVHGKVIFGELEIRYL